MKTVIANKVSSNTLLLTKKPPGDSVIKKPGGFIMSKQKTFTEWFKELPTVVQWALFIALLSAYFAVGSYLWPDGWSIGSGLGDSGMAR